MTLNAVDLSNNNADLIKRALPYNDIVIAKATEGNYQQDSTFFTIMEAGLSAGKKVGAYLFVNGGIDAEEQAQYFLDYIGEYAYDPRVMLIIDFENASDKEKYPTLSGYEPARIANYVYARTKKKMMLYIGLIDIISGQYSWEDMQDNPLWLADYANPDDPDFTDDISNWYQENVFNKLKYWRLVTMLQYSTTPWDNSIFFGDDDTWDILAKPVTSSTPEEKNRANQVLSNKMADIAKLAQQIIDKTNE